MKILFAIIFAFMLSGCYQSVNLRDIKDAAIICGDIDKVTEIQAFAIGSEHVLCTNRHSYMISPERIKENLK